MSILTTICAKKKKKKSVVSFIFKKFYDESLHIGPHFFIVDITTKLKKKNFTEDFIIFLRNVMLPPTFSI